MSAHTTHAALEKLERQQIEDRLGACPCLPSLGSVGSALRELLDADQRYTSQIADIIRKDPSLTARLLRLVNAVHYGMSKRIKNIEEAIFYLGMRQIRQLAMVTPIIEDFQVLAGQSRLEWRGFWRHCIGTALMTREIIDLAQAQYGEVDYVAGLIHDVGKIAMASAFPEHFAEIYLNPANKERELMEVEREILGMDHAELGAIYLQKQSLPDVFIECVQFHHNPTAAPNHAIVAAAVQVSDLTVQEAKIGYNGRQAPKTTEAWLATDGWRILFGPQTEDEQNIMRASVKHSMKKMPVLLESLV